MSAPFSTSTSTSTSSSCDAAPLPLLDAPLSPPLPSLPPSSHHTLDTFTTEQFPPATSFPSSCESDSGLVCDVSGDVCVESMSRRGHAPSISESVDVVGSLSSLPVRSVEYPAGFKGAVKGRRGSVSAEADRMSSSGYVRRVIPKSSSALERIQSATARSILFMGLDSEQKQQIYEAMEEVKVKAGDIVIRQYEEGDYFYVIDRGHFDVYKNPLTIRPVTLPTSPTATHTHTAAPFNFPPTHTQTHSSPHTHTSAATNATSISSSSSISPSPPPPAPAPSPPVPCELGGKVFEYAESGSFGELALMYNCPRAATVMAATDGILWRVDRETFRHIIIDSNAHKRRRYEQFLETVPLLSNLSSQERSQVADCLEILEFKAGDTIIRQGEEGDKLFLILKGVAKAMQMPNQPTASTSTSTSPSSSPSATMGMSVSECVSGAVEVGRMSEGDYFGERSLITREPRAATVIAETDLECTCMDRSAFERLLGPLKDIMHKKVLNYRTADDIIRERHTNTAHT